MTLPKSRDRKHDYAEIKKNFRLDIAGKKLTIEVSELAEQANAAVLAKYGETVVLATAVMGRKDIDMDYMPLKVDYEERFYAAGKIIGSRYVAAKGDLPKKPCSRDGSWTARSGRFLTTACGAIFRLS